MLDSAENVNPDPDPSASASALRGGGPSSRHACSCGLVVVSRIRSHGQQEEGRMCKRKAACAGAKRSGERCTTRMLRPTAPPARRMRTVGKAPRGRRKAGATGSLQATYTTHAACLHRWLPLVQRAAHGYATCTRRVHHMKPASAPHTARDLRPRFVDACGRLGRDHEACMARAVVR